MLGIAENKKEKRRVKELGVWDVCALVGGEVEYSDKVTFKQILESTKGE